MDEAFADFLTLVIQAVIAAGLPVLLVFVLGWIKSKRKLVEQYLTEEQRQMIHWVCRSVVLAAEQSGLTEQITNEGEAKKVWAVAEASAWLAEIGLPVDLASISAQIEGIVMEYSKSGWEKPRASSY